MSLYPSLEDMKAGETIQAQISAVTNAANAAAANAGAGQSHSQGQGAGFHYPSLTNNGAVTAPSAPGGTQMTAYYPRLHDFMGLELTEEMIRLNMPEYLEVAVAKTDSHGTGGGQLQLAPKANSNNALVAPISGALQPFTHNAVRRLQLPKPSTSTKLGLRVRSMNTGVFVCLVVEGTAAAKQGLRFGDQILQINGSDVVGMDVKTVHGILKGNSAAPGGLVDLVVRDRPFERTITLVRDSQNHVGFQFKNGKIINIVQDSSAARNGLLTQHHLLEINGKNVIGMKDKEITKVIQDAAAAGPGLNVTVMPSFLYEHMVKEMDKSLFGKMDHSGSAELEI